MARKGKGRQRHPGRGQRKRDDPHRREGQHAFAEREVEDIINTFLATAAKVVGDNESVTFTSYMDSQKEAREQDMTIDCTTHSPSVGTAASTTPTSTTGTRASSPLRFYIGEGIGYDTDTHTEGEQPIVQAFGDLDFYLDSQNEEREELNTDGEDFGYYTEGEQPIGNASGQAQTEAQDTGSSSQKEEREEPNTEEITDRYERALEKFIEKRHYDPASPLPYELVWRAVQHWCEAHQVSEAITAKLEESLSRQHFHE